jgi:hypothetical protein
MENSSFGRIISVLVSPKKTFQAIAERPTWAVAMITLAAIGAIVAFIIVSKVDMAALMIEGAAERGQEITEEQAEKIASVTRWAAPIQGAVASIVIYLLAALVFWVAFKILGSEMGYKKSLAVTVHSMAPGAVAGLFSVVVVMTKTEIPLAQLQSGKVLLSNLAAFAPEGASPALVALLGAFDIFALWMLVLFVIGYRTVAKTSRGATIAVVVAAWLVAVAVGVGLAMLRGGAG